MQNILIDTRKISMPTLCSRCGGAMRLVGSEPHPVAPATDLLTYTCTVCDALDVVPVPLTAT